MILYEKDIELLLATTAGVNIGWLTKVPFIGKHFDFPELRSFRAKLKNAQESRQTFVLEDELDIELLVSVVYSSLKGSKATDDMLNCQSYATIVLEKLLSRLYEAYPEYFEVE